MGRISEKTVFITDDGAQYPNLQDAKAHDEMLELVFALNKEFGDMTRGVRNMDLAQWLVDNYEISLKGPA